MDRATSCTLNSEHDGGAVLVIKSKRLLQSVTAKSVSWGTVDTEMAGSTLQRAVSGLFHSVVGSCNHFQYSRNQDSWSRAVASEAVSADKVDVTTRWIFLLPHINGEIGHSVFFEISWWVATVMLPAYELGLLWDANEASEKVIKRRSWWGMDLMVMVTSWWRLASCNKRLASISVSMVPELILDCKLESRFDKSGRVLVEACCNDPTKPRRCPLSLSLISRLGWVFRWKSIGIGDIFRT